MSEDFQEIKTAQQLENALREKPVYGSIETKIGGAAKAEKFISRAVSLFNRGSIEAVYFPNETETKVKIRSTNPKKSVYRLFIPREPKPLLPLSAGGKDAMFWAHPDPAHEDLMIINTNPWHQDPAHVDFLCGGRPMPFLGTRRRRLSETPYYKLLEKVGILEKGPSGYRIKKA